MTDSAHPHTDQAESLLKRLFAADTRLLWIATILAAAALVLWAWFTPPGVLGKADAVGYAVCHRIEARSFLFPDGRQFPLCARCTGTFLGVLIGLFLPGLLFRRRHAGLFPPIGILAIMVTMSGIWAFDGANSFSHLLPGSVFRLYQPSNFLRLTTGTFHGITMGSLILPVVNASIWADTGYERTVNSLPELLVLYATGAVLIGLVLTGLPVLVYPLALLSAAGTVAILDATMTVIAAVILRRENEAHTLREALPLILLGLVLTLIMMGGIDALRFAAFGTWDGFEFPGS